jgi:hypothetical protein
MHPPPFNASTRLNGPDKAGPGYKLPQELEPSNVRFRAADDISSGFAEGRGHLDAAPHSAPDMVSRIEAA